MTDISREAVDGTTFALRHLHPDDVDLTNAANQLDALLDAAEGRVTRLEAALEVYEDALTEAEAIFGGEYADHYGPMCEMAFAARDARLAALTPTADKESTT